MPRLTTACTRPRIALLSCARLGAIGVGCAAGDARRYTKEGYAATIPKSDVIKNRFGEGKIWVVILNKKSSARFPLFPKMNLCIFAVWRF